MALATYGVARLLGVELTVGKGQNPSEVGPAEVPPRPWSPAWPPGVVPIWGFARFVPQRSWSRTW